MEERSLLSLHLLAFRRQVGQKRRCTLLMEYGHQEQGDDLTGMFSRAEEQTTESFMPCPGWGLLKFSKELLGHAHP